MVRDYSQFLPGANPSGGSMRQMSVLDHLGWQPFFAQQISVDDLTRTPPARVMEVRRSGLHLRGRDIDAVIPPRADATVGDWVLYDATDPQASRVLERKSLVKRRAPGTERAVQLIAANIDTAFIVTSCNQDFNVARLERYIALAFEAEIDPVLVLTKSDQAENPQAYVEQAAAISELLPVVLLNARTEAPKIKLAPWCKPGRTVAFLGSSGVGKSTMVNALSGSQAIETQAIREGDAKGRHTTTSRQLHMIDGVCNVLDTPGMRELQMTDAASGIGDVFADLTELSHRCRFNDCQHRTEPGCAVLAALDNGEIDAARLGRWLKLVAEDAFNSASMAERRSKDKTLGKMIRKIQKVSKKRD